MVGFRDSRGAMGWKVAGLGFFRGESVVKTDVCGAGSDKFACLS